MEIKLIIFNSLKYLLEKMIYKLWNIYWIRSRCDTKKLVSCIGFLKFRIRDFMLNKKTFTK